MSSTRLISGFVLPGWLQLEDIIVSVGPARNPFAANYLPDYREGKVKMVKVISRKLAALGKIWIVPAL